jgi:molybdate transport system regulatory protein
MHPTIRLHLWLEDDKSMVLGYGRVLLLDKIEECGSLSKAAAGLGMSYQAAWNKLRAMEETLGVNLVHRPRCRSKGMTLTNEGVMLRDSFKAWVEAVEQCAFTHAKHLFPWHLRNFDKPLSIVR